MEKKNKATMCGGYLFNIKEIKSFLPVCKVAGFETAALTTRVLLTLCQVERKPFLVSRETLAQALDTSPLKVAGALRQLRSDNKLSYSYLTALKLYCIEAVNIDVNCSCPYGFKTCGGCMFLKGCNSGSCSIQSEEPSEEQLW